MNVRDTGKEARAAVREPDAATVRAAIRKVVDGEHLAEDEAAAVATAIMEGHATPAQIAALLVGLRMKGETVQELVGFARVMRTKMRTCPVQSGTVIDTCGTGGDGRRTFNISTATAIVAAAAGARVAKHGNRSVSSHCGSADVLTALGVRIDAPPEVMARCIDTIGIGFLFAPLYHPAMKHAIGPRREVGVRTIFNLIGPITNPAGARRQLLGIFDGVWADPLARVLHRLGSTHCLIVHSEDGLDEISIAAPTRVTELRDGTIRSYTIRPEDFGLASSPLSSIQTRDVEDNVRFITEVLQGRPGPARDVVLFNAGAAIYVAGVADSIADGIRRAREAIDTGRAWTVLETFRRMTTEATA